MPSGTGPCRFGSIMSFTDLFSTALVIGRADIFAEPGHAFYRDLGIVGKDFTMQAWKGIIAYELLEKCLHEMRPYEKKKGSAERLYDNYHKNLYQSLK